MNRAEWNRVSRKQPCPVCDRPDWCLVSHDGLVAICARVCEGAVKRCGDAGWLHRLREPDDWMAPRSRAVHIGRPQQQTDYSDLAQRFTQSVNPEQLQRFADGLGLSVQSLCRLRVGWDGEAWTFPMKNLVGRVIGIRRRLADGRKLSVKGGHEGLFVPEGQPASGMLLICEGPTDTAALLDLGFAAIGRPSCMGGTQLVQQFARSRDVVLVADADEPGRRGAKLLGNRLLLHCPEVRIITPPGGINDARAWRQAGATRGEILTAIEEATICKIHLQTQRVPRCARAGM